MILALGIQWIPFRAFAEETVPEESTEVTVETIPETEETIPETEETVPDATIPEETISEETISEETLPEETIPAETAALLVVEEVILGPGIYFGQLHAHTTLSDGTVTPEEAYAEAIRAGMDFLALTDNSDSLTEDDRTAGAAAAEAATGNGFAALFGYEMSWPAIMQLGHISAFAAAVIHSWEESAFHSAGSALGNYYAALAADRAIGQFCHPGTQYGNFDDFGHYSESADSVMNLLEISGEDGEAQYIKALDQGWHVAPTYTNASRNGSFGTGRTAIYAESLTEDGIYDALRQRRAYATEDADLEIYFTLDGGFMGAILEERHIGDTADITVTLSDPSDSGIGLVEVVADGAVIASQSLTASYGTLTFSLPADHGYYYLRITQPDGDRAITAPVWVSHSEDLGIAALTCNTAVPVQGGAVSLTLSLYNRESADFLVGSLEILADGETVATDDTLPQIPGGGEMDHEVTFTCNSVGQTAIKVKLSGTLEGSPRTYEASLTISFRQSELVTDIVVVGTEELSALEALAAESGIRVTFGEDISAEELENCRFLVISAPDAVFSNTFIDTVSQYAAYGGSVILCGRTDSGDSEDVHSAFQLNRVLGALGSSLRFRDDTAWDMVTNGGSADRLYVDTFNTESHWCDGVTSGQVYRQALGCTVDIGGGQWLVRGWTTTGSKDGDVDGLGGGEAESVTLLACEELITGGTVFAAGSLFLSDADLSEPESIWAEPYANRTIVENLLNIGGETLPLSAIQEARAAESGELLRIRGYVTAGTSNPYNTFPDTIYIQDDTGGIAVTPFAEEGIRVGTALEVIGRVEDRNGNRVLKLVSYEALDAAQYQYQPRTGNWENLLDYAKNGGLLVEIEGECQEITCKADGTITGIRLKNADGQTAYVSIEEGICSGATGENTLHEDIRKGRTVRATGLLHINDSGETVLRVRNCDEVVYVPPATYVNPKTGDGLPLAVTGMALSAVALLHLRKRKTI